ncbi:hypothetical protein Taro_046205, partial [Colocasia esculenta]|nr:hypothetical protein [Colocasia esculenta]
KLKEEKKRRKEEEEHKRKEVEEEQKRKREDEEDEKRKEEEEEKKRKEAEEAEKKRKEEEEHKRKEVEKEQKRKREEEEEEKRKEEEEEKKRKMHHISPSSLSRRIIAGTRKRRQPDIYTVEELRRYMKGKHIDSENWLLCYPDPCPQQGSGDDCAIFTCKYMECLARRDTQGFPFSQDDMPTVRAKFALHFIKTIRNNLLQFEHYTVIVRALHCYSLSTTLLRFEHYTITIRALHYYSSSTTLLQFEHYTVTYT